MGQLLAALAALAWPEDTENVRLRAALLAAEQRENFERQERLAAANIAESEADANVISMSNRIRDLKKSLGQAS